jgi:hypothetical protein
MASVQLKVVRNLDDQTSKGIERLRVARLHLAQRQLGDLSQTAQDLHTRGYLQNIGEPSVLLALKSELEGKIEDLENRILGGDVFYNDEVQLYLSLVDGLPAH